MASPFEHAWMLLKNVMDYGDVANELPEPNPLDAALAQARNQGPVPGANLEALPPAGPDPQVSRKYMKDPVQQGLDRYGMSRPHPERPEIRQEFKNPPPHERAINDALAARQTGKHEERMKNDFEYHQQNSNN